MSSFAFLFPWALLGLLVLPILAWLSRIHPPAPKCLDFPPILLLRAINPRQSQPRHTPWWIILLRLTLATALILAAARPILRLEGQIVSANDSTLLIVDTSWATAPDWPERKRALTSLIQQTSPQGQTLQMLVTALPADGSPIALSEPLSTDEAMKEAEALQPQPWPSDLDQSLSVLAALDHDPNRQIIWLTDGLESATAPAFIDRLASLGRFTILTPPQGSPPPALLRGNGNRLDLLPHETTARTIRVFDKDNRPITRLSVAESEDGLSLDPALAARAHRLEIEGMDHAAATYWRDHDRKRPSIGLATDGGDDAYPPLLSDSYYLRKALAPIGRLREAHIEDLLRDPPAILILPDMSGALSAHRTRLQNWIEQGGILIRFAGDKLASSLEQDEQDDFLLPIGAQARLRTLDGGLAGLQPLALDIFPADSPFAGLTPNEEIKISKYILTPPTNDEKIRIWARLSDGTPFISAKAIGTGWTIFIHSSAGPRWNTIALSGMFVALMERLTNLANGQPPNEGDQARLKPIVILDGFGRKIPAPASLAAPTVAEIRTLPPNPRLPPGLYGSSDRPFAVNLADHLPPPRPLIIPPTITARPYDLSGTEIDLTPWLLRLSLLLIVLDIITTAFVRGGSLRLRRAALPMIALIAAGLSLPTPAHAQSPDELDIALNTRLAWVVTGDSASDALSHRGLSSLSHIVSARTSVILAEPLGVDPARDPLMLFPLVYWPVPFQSSPLSAPARRAVSDYLQHGGIILFDLKDGTAALTPAFRSLTQGIDLPTLAPLSTDHVLGRSFYLLHDFSGRITGAPLWGNTEQAVSGILVGAHDWAGAWALDEQRMGLMPVTPDGEAQRERAFRFGVNLVIYALTGSYKADQVHLPAILERLQK